MLISVSMLNTYVKYIFTFPSQGFLKGFQQVLLVPSLQEVSVTRCVHNFYSVLLRESEILPIRKSENESEGEIQ